MVRPRPERTIIRPLTEVPPDGTEAPVATPAPPPSRAAAVRAAAYRPVGGSTDYSYVGKDLLRIAFIAVFLFTLMGILKFFVS